MIALTALTTGFLVVLLWCDIHGSSTDIKKICAMKLVYPVIDLIVDESAELSTSATAAIVRTLLGSLLAINTLWFAVFLPLGKIRELESSRVVEIRPIKKTGKDDLKTLMEVLEHCKQAWMFARSFKWLVKPDDKALQSETREFKKFIEARLGKITFVTTSADKASVVSGLTAVDEKFAKDHAPYFVDRSEGNHPLFLTYVDNGDAEHTLCTRVGQVRGKSKSAKNNIIIDSKTPEGRVLLENLGSLVRKVSSSSPTETEVKT